LSFRNALLLSIAIHMLVLGILYRYRMPAGSPTVSERPPLIARIIRPEERRIQPGIKEKKTPPPRALSREKKRPPHRAVKKRPVKKIPPEGKKEKEAIPPAGRGIPGTLKEKERETPEGAGMAGSEKKMPRTGKAEGPSSGLKEPPPKVGQRLPTGRELLGRDLIARAIRKEVQKQQQKRGAITFESRDLKYYSYMLKLKERIESIWTYPEEAARRGIFGDLYIEFTIRKDGSLGAVRLLRTSGYRDLDEAAMRALRDGQPYWPLPEQWGVDAITIKGHFIYTLYGMYVR